MKKDISKILVRNADGEPDTTADIVVQNHIEYTPKVSVIIPVYNVEAYLRECLDSVINQTLKDIEIICVDDGSTDKSLDILKEYAAKDNRITILKQQNLHAGVARNAGLAVAKGKYLSFLDSDDFFELNMLEEMYQGSSQNNADICVADANEFYNDIKKYRNTSIVKWDMLPEANCFTTYDFYPNLYTAISQVIWNKLYKASFIKRSKLFYQNSQSCNDTAFGYLTMCLAHTVYVCRKVFVHYRKKHNAAISNKRGKTASNILNAYKYVISQITARDIQTNLASLNESFKAHIKYELSQTSLQGYIDICDFAKYNLPSDDIISSSFKHIISLTSYPARINTIVKTITSLKKQSVQLAKVILYLGKDKFPHQEKDLPDNLLKLLDDNFEIHWVDKDLRSYTKLIPALQEYPHHVIITADDDIIYPENWLELLLVSYIKNTKVIHCHRVHRILFKDEQIKPYNMWKQEYSKSSTSYNNFLTGVGGVLYPPDCLDKEVLNIEKFQKLAPYADDIWFWAMAVKKGTSIKLVENNVSTLTYVDDSQEGEDCLYKINTMGQKLNDTQLSNVLAAYPEVYDKLIKNDSSECDSYTKIAYRLFGFIPLLKIEEKHSYP